MSKSTARETKRWTLRKHGMSPSMMTLFLSCREQFRLEFPMGWRSKYVPDAIKFGVCGHHICEGLYGIRDRPPRQADVIDLVKDYEMRWYAGMRHVTEVERQTQERIHALAEAVYTAYVVRYRGDWTGLYTRPSPDVKFRDVISLETRYRVPIELTNGETVPIVGTRDLVIKDREGRAWVIDHKHYSRINEDELQDSLSVNLQQMTYLWSLWRETGTVPTGLVLNVVRRPMTHYLKTDDVQSWSRRVHQQVKKRKQWDHYFKRFTVRVSTNQLVEFENEILRPTMDMVRMWVDGELPHGMNPTALVNRYGKCAMFYMIVKGSDHNCVQRTNVMDYAKEIT